MKPVGDDPRERLADAEQALWDVARIAKCEVEYPAALWRDLLRMAQDGIDARADAVASRTANTALAAVLALCEDRGDFRLHEGCAREVRAAIEGAS